MSKKFQSKMEKTDVILWLVVLILIILILSIVVSNFGRKDNSQQPQALNIVSENKTTVAVPKNDEELVKKLATMGERDRMEYYCGEYFKHIEKQEYEAAYNMLYDEFKKNYFPSLEKYEEYVKKTYPESWVLEYDDISRQGNIYVLRLKVGDAFGSKDDVKVQRVVIQENNYNNFIMSFQVI